MIRTIRVSALPATLVLAGGCGLTADTSRPSPAVPAEFPTGPAYAAPADADATPAVPDLPLAEVFPDERLRRIVGLAIAGNADLRIAAANVRRARALYGVQESFTLPSADASAGVSGARTAADFSPGGKPSTATTWRVTLPSVQWEIDLFGRLGHLTDAALESFLATREAERSAQVVLVLAVASARG